MICRHSVILSFKGKFHLNQPISDFLPEFSEMKVLVDGVSVPANKQITFLHLLTHTSGLTYHFLQDDDVAKMYREANIDFLSLSNQDLGSTVKRLAQLPLVGQPGEMWNYGCYLRHTICTRHPSPVKVKPINTRTCRCVNGRLGPSC